MTSWTAPELERLAGDDHMGIASRRADGSLGPYVTIWFVRAGDDLYVRSAYGPQNGWYRRALASGAGRIRVGRDERDVAFEVTDEPALAAELHRAFHAKYDRYGAAYVASVVSDEAASCTLRLVPQ